MTARFLQFLSATAVLLTSALAAGILATEARADDTTRLEGIYMPLHVDTGPHAGLHSFWLKTKDHVIRLDLEGMPEPAAGARIAVEGSVSASGVDVTDIDVLAAPKAAAPTSGVVSALVIQVRWGSVAPAATQSQARTFVFGSQATSTASWLHQASSGRITLDGTVTPLLTIADPGTCTASGSYLDLLAQRADAAAANAGYNLAAYPIRIINTPLAMICGARGWGSLVNGHTWIANGLVNESNGYERFIVVHEVGHNFGLNHSHGVECGATAVSAACLSSASSNVEYGDPYDAMGSNAAGWGQNGIALYSARQMQRIGWLGKPVQTVTASGTYTISPLELATPAYTQALAITTATRSYTVEFRQALGVDSFMSFLAPSPTNGVLIHMRNDLPSGDTGPLLLDMTPGSRSGDADFYDASLTVGRTFTDLGRTFTVKVLSVGSNGAKVQVTFAGSGTNTTTTTTTTTDKTAPRISMRGEQADGQITGSLVPVRTSFSASDPSGIAFVNVWLKEDGVWHNKGNFAAGTTGVRALLTNGHEYRFAVRAKDAAGNLSQFAYGSTFRVETSDDGIFTLGGGFGRYSWSEAFGGTALTSSTPNDVVRFSFVGREAALVAPKFASAGRAFVYCDDQPSGMVDLYASSLSPRQIAVRCDFVQSTSHTMKLVLEGTSGRARFDVDAFVVLR
jgi:hypothetical protein